MSGLGSAAGTLRRFSKPGELRTLAAVMLTAVVIAVLVISVWPSKYVANSTLLLDPSGEGANLINLAQISDLLPPGSLPSQSRKENGYTYAAMTQSRAILMHMLATRRPSKPNETFLARFAPRTGSPPARAEAATKRLRKSISTKFDSRSGVFEIAVSHNDPVIAYELGTLLVEELRRFNLEVRTTRARDAVAFVTQRVEESRLSLAAAEQKLASFKGANARIGNAPELLLQQKRLERDVRLGEDIYGLLAKQLELARIQEKRESPTFSVVDPAVEPTRPLRLSRILGGLLAALVAGAAYILIQVGLLSSERSEMRDRGKPAHGAPQQ